MKIAYTSDIHLEFGNIVLDNTENADVIILAGDIFVIRDLLPQTVNGTEWPMMARAAKIHDFFIDCSKKFKHVIFITGNHEVYHTDIKTAYSDIRKYLGYIENLHILDNEIFELDGVVFAGGTLWTDMSKGSRRTIDAARFGMNDFRIIKNSDVMIEYEAKVSYFDDDLPIKKYKPSLFTPEASIDKFNETVAFLKKTVEKYSDKTIVVLTHHAPSFRSVSPAYKNETILNGAFCSDLESFIESSKIKLWIHGHIHHRNDFMIGNTHLVSNPRGYVGSESIANSFELKYIKIH